MVEVVIAGAGPNGLMPAGEPGLGGVAPVVLDPLPGPNPGPRANGIVGQGVRILDHPLVGRWVPDFGVATHDGARRVAELARDGRPLLVDLTESGCVADDVIDTAGVNVAAGSPVGDVAATALLVRPDGYVAWASSAAAPGQDELDQLRGVLAQWFGITATSR